MSKMSTLDLYTQESTEAPITPDPLDVVVLMAMQLKALADSRPDCVQALDKQGITYILDELQGQCDEMRNRIEEKDNAD